MRPLDRLPSIKVKLGVVIVATVFGTVGVLALGYRAGLRLPLRARGRRRHRRSRSCRSSRAG